MTQAENKKSITQTSTSHRTERGKQARCEGLSVCTGMRAGQSEENKEKEKKKTLASRASRAIFG